MGEGEEKNEGLREKGGRGSQGNQQEDGGVPKGGE
jgi:hypothetical protein